MTDAELSAAVLAYYSKGSSPYPWVDEGAVRALATRRSGDELLAEVIALDRETFAIPVDWAQLSLSAAGDHVRSVMGSRHPELDAKALDALRWNFTYVSR